MASIVFVHVLWSTVRFLSQELSSYPFSKALLCVLKLNVRLLRLFRNELCLIDRALWKDSLEEQIDKIRMMQITKHCCQLTFYQLSCAVLAFVAHANWPWWMLFFFLNLQWSGFSTGNGVVILKARLYLPLAFWCGLWYEITGCVVVHSRIQRRAQLGCDLLVEGTVVCPDQTSRVTASVTWMG